MTVTQRSKGVWLVQVYNGRDPVTGKVRRPSRVVRGRKAEAIAVEARLILDCKAGAHHRTRGHTFGELVEKWATSKAPDWSPATVREHRRIINANLRGLAAVKLDKITPASLDDLYGRLRAAGGKGGGPLGLSTVRRIHGVVRAALEQGVRWGWLEHNPAQRAFLGTKVKAPQVKKRVPSPSAVSTFLAGAWKERPMLAAEVTLDAHTGLRRGELLALRWNDLDKDAAILDVARTIVYGPGGLVEKPSTKNERDRLLPLAPETMAVLAAHRKWCVERALAAGSTLPADALMFSGEPDGSKPYWPSSLSRSVRLFCQSIGVEQITMQQLRRFVSSTMYMGGVDPATEMETLGHGSGVALRDYAETHRPAQKRAMQVVVDALRGTDADIGPGVTAI